MIIDKIENAHKYYGYSKNMETALRFIESTDLGTVEESNHIDVDGEEVYAKTFVFDNEVEIVNSHQWEAHLNHLDIWCLCEGEQLVGWRPLENGFERIGEYDAENDISFYKAVDDFSLIRQQKGYFLVLEPNDAHMVGSFAVPGRDPHIKNLVVKVKIG